MRMLQSCGSTATALAYVFVLVAEAKSVLMTRMGKATSPKKAFLANSSSRRCVLASLV